MSPIIAPSMTVTQIAELVERHRSPNTECYVRIESVRGKPVVFMVREPVNASNFIPPLLRHQAPEDPVPDWRREQITEKYSEPREPEYDDYTEHGLNRHDF
jgi:hypothetical protein